MRTCLRLVIVFLVLSLSSCGTRQNDSLDLTPRIETVNAELIGVALNHDADFFQRWSQGKMYEGFILDIANASDYKDINKYAAKRFEAFSKEQRYKLKESDIRYVLYCADSHEVFIKMKTSASSMMDGTHPGALYKLSVKKYPNASELIRKLADLNIEALRDYENLSRLQRIGLTNPILESVKLALNKAFIPSDSFWFRFFFSLPFGAGMTGVCIFGSASAACVFFLLLFIICNMAFVRRDTRGRRFDMAAAMAWGTSVMAFFAFCCLVNSIEPSADLRYGMMHNGYAYVFNSHYALAYAQYTKTLTPTFFVVAIAVLFSIDALLSYSIKQASKTNEDSADDGSNDNPLGGVVAVITGAIVSDSTLAYIVLAYLLFRIVRTLYSLFSFVPKRSFQDWPVWILVAIVLLMYIGIPFVVDDSSPEDYLRNTAAVLWGSMSLSGAFHFIHSGFKERKSPLPLFINQTYPKEKWSIANSISLNMYFAAGLTSPLFLLICLIYALFPNHTHGIDVFLLYLLGICCAICIAVLIDEADDRHNLSSLINSSWKSFTLIPMNELPKDENRVDVIIVRLFFAFSWMAVVSISLVVFLVLLALVLYTFLH